MHCRTLCTAAELDNSVASSSTGAMKTEAKRTELLMYCDQLSEALDAEDRDEVAIWYRILLPAATDCGGLWVDSGGQGPIGEFYLVDHGELHPMQEGPHQDTAHWIREFYNQIRSASKGQVDHYHAWASALTTR